MNNKQKHILATDLDGTLIPLDGNEQNRRDLEKLKQLNERISAMIFVTGRHYSSVLNVLQEKNLPHPHSIVCNVGTEIYQTKGESDRIGSDAFELVDGYQTHIGSINNHMSVEQLHSHLQTVEGIELQEERKQSSFKLSYYADAKHQHQICDQIQLLLENVNAPYNMISSVDPFNGNGLIDLLPKLVNKAYALKWWIKELNYDPEHVVFAGDSGNDLAPLTAGYRSILVNNGGQILADRIRDEHLQSGWKNRFYYADQDATSGVLEGCQWYGFMES